MIHTTMNAETIIDRIIIQVDNQPAKKCSRSGNNYVVASKQYVKGQEPFWLREPWNLHIFSYMSESHVMFFNS